MVNRNDTYDIISSRKKLKERSRDMGYQHLYINDNLNQENRNILKEAKQLKNAELISSCWSFNGHIYIKINENERYGKKINHMSDFEDHFSTDQLGW